jgi:hypothetical protein
VKKGESDMRKLVLLAACAALAACGKGPQGEDRSASVAEVAKKAGGAGMSRVFVDPGLWEQTVTLLSVDAPGMPPEARASMRQAMGHAQVHRACLTPEEAKNPREDFFTGKDENCRYQHFNWGGGKIDLKLECEHPNAKQMMELAGTYEARRYSLTMTATNEGSRPEEQLVMKMRVDARHIGPCAAGEG